MADESMRLAAARRSSTSDRPASPDTSRIASASRLQAQTVTMISSVGASGAHGW